MVESGGLSLELNLAKSYLIRENKVKENQIILFSRKICYLPNHSVRGYFVDIDSPLFSGPVPLCYHLNKAGMFCGTGDTG